MKLLFLTKRCSVEGCQIGRQFNGDNYNIEFFDIPSHNPKLTEQWLAVIGNSEDGNKRVCEAHFKAGDIAVDHNLKKVLRPNVVPSVNLPVRVCRTCMSQIREKYYTLESTLNVQGIPINLRDLLKYCLISIEKVKVPHPVICEGCYQKLHVCYMFKMTLGLKLNRAAALSGIQNVPLATCYSCSASMQADFKTIEAKTPLGSCLKKIMNSIQEHEKDSTEKISPVLCNTCKEMLSRIVEFKKEIRRVDRLLNEYLKDAVQKESTDVLQKVSRIQQNSDLVVIPVTPVPVNDEKQKIDPLKIVVKNQTHYIPTDDMVTITPIPAMNCSVEMNTGHEETKAVPQHISPKKKYGVKERRPTLRWSPREKETLFNAIKKSFICSSRRGLNIEWDRVVSICREKYCYGNEEELKKLWNRMKTNAKNTPEFKRSHFDQQILKFVRDKKYASPNQLTKRPSLESDFTDSRESFNSGCEVEKTCNNKPCTITRPVDNHVTPSSANNQPCPSKINIQRVDIVSPAKVTGASSRANVGSLPHMTEPYKQNVPSLIITKVPKKIVREKQSTSRGPALTLSSTVLQKTSSPDNIETPNNIAEPSCSIVTKKTVPIPELNKVITEKQSTPMPSSAALQNALRAEKIETLSNTAKQSCSGATKVLLSESNKVMREKQSTIVSSPFIFEKTSTASCSVTNKKKVSLSDSKKVIREKQSVILPSSSTLQNTSTADKTVNKIAKLSCSGVTKKVSTSELNMVTTDKQSPIVPPSSTLQKISENLTNCAKPSCSAPQKKFISYSEYIERGKINNVTITSKTDKRKMSTSVTHKLDQSGAKAEILSKAGNSLENKPVQKRKISDDLNKKSSLETIKKIKGAKNKSDKIIDSQKALTVKTSGSGSTAQKIGNDKSKKPSKTEVYKNKPKKRKYEGENVSPEPKTKHVRHEVQKQNMPFSLDICKETTAQFDEDANIVKISIPVKDDHIGKVNNEGHNLASEKIEKTKQAVERILNDTDHHNSEANNEGHNSASEKFRKTKQAEARILNDTSADDLVKALEECLQTMTNGYSPDHTEMEKEPDEQPCCSKDIIDEDVPGPGNEEVEAVNMNVLEQDDANSELKIQDNMTTNEPEPQEVANNEPVIEDDSSRSSHDSSFEQSHMSAYEIEKMFNVDLLSFTFNAGLIKEKEIGADDTFNYYFDEDGVIVINDDESDAG